MSSKFACLLVGPPTEVSEFFYPASEGNKPLENIYACAPDIAKLRAQTCS
jgi:hypothetical protein